MGGRKSALNIFLKNKLVSVEDFRQYVFLRTINLIITN